MIKRDYIFFFIFVLSFYGCSNTPDCNPNGGYGAEVGCSESRPYCEPETLNCVVCYSDSQCMHNEDATSDICFSNFCKFCKEEGDCKEGHYCDKTGPHKTYGTCLPGISPKEFDDRYLGTPAGFGYVALKLSAETGMESICFNELSEYPVSCTDDFFQCDGQKYQPAMLEFIDQNHPDWDMISPYLDSGFDYHIKKVTCRDTTDQEPLLEDYVPSEDFRASYQAKYQEAYRVGFQDAAEGTEKGYQFSDFCSEGSSDIDYGCHSGSYYGYHGGYSDGTAETEEESKSSTSGVSQSIFPFDTLVSEPGCLYLDDGVPDDRDGFGDYYYYFGNYHTYDVPWTVQQKRNTPACPAQPASLDDLWFCRNVWEGDECYSDADCENIIKGAKCVLTEKTNAIGASVIYDGENIGYRDSDEECSSVIDFGSQSELYDYVFDFTEKQTVCLMPWQSVWPYEYKLVEGSNPHKSRIDSIIPCENPFERIKSDLDSGNSTLITENNFARWFSWDRFDHYEGSGDKFDIIELMRTYQEKAPNSKESFERFPYAIEDVEKAVEKAQDRLPSIVGWLYYQKQGDDYFIPSNKGLGHAVVILDAVSRISDQSTGEIEYLLEVLDPNTYPSTYLLFCQERFVSVLNPFISSEGQIPEKIRVLGCTDDYYSDPHLIMLHEFKFFGGDNRARDNPIGWLENTQLPVFNMEDWTEKGFCYGFSELYSRVAIWGKFGRECSRICPHLQYGDKCISASRLGICEYVEESGKLCQAPPTVIP